MRSVKVIPETRVRRAY